MGMSYIRISCLKVYKKERILAVDIGVDNLKSFEVTDDGALLITKIKGVKYLTDLKTNRERSIFLDQENSQRENRRSVIQTLLMNWQI